MQNRISGVYSAKQRGFVLITVIWGIGLMSLLVMTFVLNIRTQTKLTSNLISRAQLEAYADAGLSFALLDLINNGALHYKQKRFPHNGETVSCALSDKVTLTVAIQDEEGKLDLNTAGAPLLKSLLLHLTNSEEDASRYADTIIDFRDTNKTPLPNGAEDDAYASSGKKQRPKNFRFQSEEELHQVLNLPQPLIQTLKPLTTIYSKRNGIDPTIAPKTLQLALNEGNNISQLYKIHSNHRAFQIQIMAKHKNSASFVRKAVVILDKTTSKGYRILAWGLGDILKEKTGGAEC